jgi:probable selenium-dependent hydroxylase accessory protein YqeC
MQSEKAPLSLAFNLSSSGRGMVALVGGGGKTSLMFALADELNLAGQPVITTTTTRILCPAPHQSPLLVLTSEPGWRQSVRAGLSRHGHVTVARSTLPGNKLEGLGVEEMAACTGLAQRVIVEADGAAGRPLKSPEAWEPVVPAATDLLIPVTGLDSLDQPATDQWVFRLPLFLAITGLREGDRITQRALATAIVHEHGLVKGRPPGCRVVPFLNKVDALAKAETAEEVAEHILRLTTGLIQRVVAGSLYHGTTCRTYGLA